MTSFMDDYEPVEDRLRQFWHDHPTGRINTEIVASDDGDYIVKASVWSEPNQERPKATGYAHDSVDQLPANMKASALEVCETSAIGRALANLGYAPKGKRPSREEMAKASGNDGEHGEGSRQPEGDAAGPAVVSPAPLLNPVVVESLDDLAALWTEASKVKLTGRRALAVATTLGLGVKSAAELDVPQMRQVLTKWIEMERVKALDAQRKARAS